MTRQQTVKVLSYLYRIVEASEKGYAAAAANVNHRGVKYLFKSYAQQRAKFKSEVLAAIQNLGSHIKPRPSIRGVIHRGRINILAAMTIGDENVEKAVLGEVVLGEKAAAKAYKKTLEKDLPPETREMIARQFEAVRRVIDEVNLMRGKESRRLVVQLFDSIKDAEKAGQALKEAGLVPEGIEKIPLDKAVELYKGRGATVLETFVSGAVGGALWGTPIGALAGLGVVQTPDLNPTGAMTLQGIWALVALAGMLGGAFVGAVIGLFIGMGIMEEDAYTYEQSIKHGQVLFKMVVDQGRASEARRIISQVNLDPAAWVEKAPSQS